MRSNSTQGRAGPDQGSQDSELRPRRNDFVPGECPARIPGSAQRRNLGCGSNASRGPRPDARHGGASWLEGRSGVGPGVRPLHPSVGRANEAFGAALHRRTDRLEQGTDDVSGVEGKKTLTSTRDKGETPGA